MRAWVIGVFGLALTATLTAPKVSRAQEPQAPSDAATPAESPTDKATDPPKG
jgi:hypothetical protein